MKPMTTRRFRFIGRGEGETSNVQRPTSNVQLGRELDVDVGRWTLDVSESGDSRVSSSFLMTTAGLPATTTLGGTLFVTTAPAATTEFSPIVTPFKIVAFIPIQTLSAMMTGIGAQLRPRRAILEKGRERLRIDESLGRFDRMKIGVGDADVP